MDKDILKLTIKEAIKEYKKEEIREQNKMILRNTSLLMKNYNDLKAHVEQSISDVKEIDGFDSEWDNIIDLSKDELYILSIKRSKVRTLIMLAHLDQAIDMLVMKHKKQGSYEKVKAFICHYIKGKTYEYISDEMHMSDATTRRWIKDILNELSVFLFGIDSFKVVS